MVAPLLPALIIPSVIGLLLLVGLGPAAVNLAKLSFLDVSFGSPLLIFGVGFMLFILVLRSTRRR